MKQKIERGFTAFANWGANAAGKPLMSTLAFGFVLIWALLGSRYDYSDHWLAVGHTFAAVVAFLMVFILQKFAEPRRGFDAGQT